MTVRTAALAASVALAAPGLARADEHAGRPGEMLAIGAFETADGDRAGTVSVSRTPNGLLLVAEVIGLEPGEHGFHIHETGRCEGPDFASAGGHWSPEGRAHGFAAEDGPHAGDMPNIFVNNDGFAQVHRFLDAATPAGDAEALMDGDGAAVVVHEDADSYLTEPRADGRVACAVLAPTTDT